MKLNPTVVSNKYYTTPHGLTQEEVNWVLRPGKQRFGRWLKNNPNQYMYAIAKRELGKYQNHNRHQYNFIGQGAPKKGHDTSNIMALIPAGSCVLIDGCLPLDHNYRW